MISKPQSWNDCVKMLSSPELEQALAVRLVELAFGDQGSVAIRAIELLRTIPRPQSNSVYSELTTDQLLQVEQRLETWLQQQVSSDELRDDGAGRFGQDQD